MTPAGDEDGFQDRNTHRPNEDCQHTDDASSLDDHYVSVEGDDQLEEPQLRRLVVPESADGQRIDVFLTAVLDGFSRSQIRNAVQADAADVDGRNVRPSFKLRGGQKILFRVPPLPADGSIPEPMDLDILHEDDAIVVLNKEPGVVVHPARGHWSGTLTCGLAYHFQSLSDIGGPTRPGIVHRLDRDTSGVILVAKTNAAHMHVAQQFHDRTVQKEYLAITNSPIDRDRDWIETSIGRHPYQRDKMAIRDAQHHTAKNASTFYQVEERFGRYTLVRCRPKTGRTHQIRVHMESIGAPILCDRLYAGHASIGSSELLGQRPGKDESPLLSRQALHAASLQIVHPHTGREMQFQAPLADDLQAVVNLLRDAKI